MPQISPLQLAGAFDLGKTAKFGWGSIPLSTELGAFTGTSGVDPYAEVRTKYKQQSFDPSVLDKDAQSVYAMAKGLQGDVNQLIAQSELKRIETIEANKMARENIKLAEEASIRERERNRLSRLRERGQDFAFEQLGGLLTSIPRAFSPIPWDKTQEVVANIANIRNPRNLSPMAQLQQAQFAMPNRQYFS